MSRTTEITYGDLLKAIDSGESKKWSDVELVMNAQSATVKLKGALDDFIGHTVRTVAARYRFDHGLTGTARQKRMTEDTDHVHDFTQEMKEKFIQELGSMDLAAMALASMLMDALDVYQETMGERAYKLGGEQ